MADGVGSQGGGEGVQEDGGSLMPLEEVEGVGLPSIFRSCGRPLEEQVRLLKALPMRDPDVLLLAYPKSGMHLSWEAISMLLSGTSDYAKQSMACAMLEATPIDDFNNHPASIPRVLTSHLPLRLLPREVKEKKVKVIHVYRNVKDVLVSAYFHYRQIPGAENLTLDSLEKTFYSGKAPYGSYVQYMREMYDYRQNNPDVPVFTMSFEDMKEDPEKMVGKLAEFLGVEASAQLSQGIAQATSFSKMKGADKAKQHPDNIPSADIYRKGEVGDWKNYLTVAQSQRLEAAMTELQSCDFSFRYTL